jgi:hypothetical protein
MTVSSEPMDVMVVLHPHSGSCLHFRIRFPFFFFFPSRRPVLVFVHSCGADLAPRWPRP